MKNYTYTSIWIALILAVLACSIEAKKNYDAPHHHRGVLTSYEAGPFDSIDLDGKDEKTLGQGKPIMKQIQEEGDELGGTSICVQDVAAPKVCLLFWKFL